MSTFKFNGPINGPSQFGDSTTMNVTIVPPVSQAAVSRAQELRDRVRAEAPEQAEEADALHAALAAAQQQGAAADGTVVGSRLARLMSGLAAGSALLTMAEQLKQLLFG
jgi:hypothetical protein